MTSAPSSSPAVASPETLSDLEFPRALGIVAGYAVSTLGAQSVAARVPVSSHQWVRGQLDDVNEFRHLLTAGRAVDPPAIEDITGLIARLATGGSVLAGPELNAVGDALQSMHDVGRALAALHEEAPRTAALAVELPPGTLSVQVERAIDRDGTVRDDASPKLAGVRRAQRAKRKALVALLERLLLERGSGDGGVTMRGDRYVIPVRRDDRDGIRGIVHGESASGTTLYVEPHEAVELGNDLSSLKAEEARAELAVLRDLTNQFRPHVERLRRGLDMCVRLDDLSARGRYAVAGESHVPQLGQTADGVTIVHGVHPLLGIEPGVKPVPFDVMLDRGECVLVVSGPNAGGKTVLLKAIGLMSCLVQAGIMPPVGAGTKLPIFSRVFVDIGDHQSIAASLSSFSAHLTRLREVLRHADRESLVLLDEIGGGTDPIEGAALAGSVLLSLNTRQSLTVATTHLSQLKDLAAGTPGFVNGSLHFDLDTLAPTYRFVKGRPGRSYGLAIARRLELPDDVLAVAAQLEPERAREIDALLEELERREEVVLEREQAAAAEFERSERGAREIARDREALVDRERELRERARALEQEGREQARRFLLDARRRVEEALGLARAAVDEATAKEARRLVEEGVRAEADALAKLEREGWRVSGSGGGSKKPIVVRPGDAPSGRGEELRESARVSAGDVEVTASSEIDLRGMTADEAEFELIKALDAAVAADLAIVRIIHGKGTGRLKQVTGDVLRRDNRVAGFRLAPPHQGGVGVTIVELRA